MKRASRRDVLVCGMFNGGGRFDGCVGRLAQSDHVTALILDPPEAKTAKSGFCLETVSNRFGTAGSNPTR